MVPASTVPYLISVCFARSSADSIGDCIRSTVRNAARFAVYDEIMMSVKNHQTLPTIRPDIDLSTHNNTLRNVQLSIASAGVDGFNSLFTPPTRTRQNCLVLSCPNVRVGGVNTIEDKTRQFCLVSTQFLICNCSVSNILRITKNLEIGNWVKTRQNCPVLSLSAV